MSFPLVVYQRPLFSKCSLASITFKRLLSSVSSCVFPKCCLWANLDAQTSHLYVFFSCVRSFMYNEGRFLSKGRCTNIALEWLYSFVCLHMFVKRCLAGKRKWAITTFIWLKTSVRQNMFFEAVVSSKCQGTTVALIWLFSCMNSFMISKSLFMSKGSWTGIALKWP